MDVSVTFEVCDNFLVPSCLLQLLRKHKQVENIERRDKLARKERDIKGSFPTRGVLLFCCVVNEPSECVVRDTVFAVLLLTLGST